MRITALYAALLAPLFVLLALRVIAVRRRARVAVGDGGDTELQRRMRVQANFAEYVPFALLLLALAEGLGSAPALIHVLGLALLGGRLSHAWGMSQAQEVFGFRVAGMIATFTVIAAAALLCLLGALPG
jgi:uncharacterized membrane protein YecN with MAPEG domain